LRKGRSRSSSALSAKETLRKGLQKGYGNAKNAAKNLQGGRIF